MTRSHTEKPDQPCGSSHVALRDFFTLWLERLELFYSRRFEDLEAKTKLALEAADKAVTKAEIATEKRFEGVNEFRQTLSDQASNFLPRTEYTARHDALEKEVTTLGREMIERRETDSHRAQDRGSLRQSWIIPMVVIGILTLINLIISMLPHITK